MLRSFAAFEAPVNGPLAERYGVPGFEAIEAAFLAARCVPPNLPDAFERAFASLGLTGWGSFERAGLAVAQAIEAMPRLTPEPLYHDRYHTAEVTQSMAWLCRVGMAQGVVTPTDAVRGVVAVIGHDMHHDGSLTRGGVLEERARAGVEPIARAAGVAEDDLAAIADIIRATDPGLIAGNAARLTGSGAPGPFGRGHDVLRVLANEADLCGSLMPVLGPRLGALLAAEWAASGDATLLHVGSAAGRLSFLQAQVSFSGPATAIGLPASRACCLAAYCAAGLALAGDATPEAGAAALDRLDPAAAAAAYAEALSAVQPARAERH